MIDRMLDWSSSPFALRISASKAQLGEAQEEKDVYYIFVVLDPSVSLTIVQWLHSSYYLL